MNYKALIIGVFSCVTLAVAFTNCGGSAFELSSELKDSSLTLLSKASCDEQLLFHYKSSLQPFFSNSARCLNCHSGSGPGVGKFANPDPVIAFSSARNMGVPNLLRQSYSNHKLQEGKTGPQNEAVAKQLETRWTKISADYEICLVKENPDKLKTVTIEDLIPTNLSSEKEMIFNLSEAVSRPINAEFKVKVGSIRDGTTSLGYYIKDPTVKFLSANEKPLVIEQILFSLNGVVIEEATAFNSLQKLLNKTIETFAYPSGSVNAPIYRSPAAEDRLGLVVYMRVASAEDIRDLEDNGAAVPSGGGAGPGISYGDLMSPGDGVFANRCVSCHQPGNARGGFDITNYNTAVAFANNSIQRMENANNPMPPAGRLSIAERAQVRSWIDGGTPQ